MLSQFIPVAIPNNPKKVIKKLGIFHYEADADATPWHVTSPLNLTPTTIPFLKFEGHLLKLPGNRVTFVNENLSTFSNVCANIGAHDNDTQHWRT